jgi:hypothetical protein
MIALVRYKVSPGEIMLAGDDLTIVLFFVGTAQADALAAAYIGKWIVVTGKVRDIYGSVDALVAQICDKDERFISAGFSKEASEKISQIAHGTTITIR